MMIKAKKDDFVEIEFIGRIKDTGEVFDTNIKEEAEKAELKIEGKTLIVCIGREMLVKGFDKQLEDKELDKNYKIDLKPEEAFGIRQKTLVKIIPLSVFKEKNVNPVPGAMMNFDGMLARIITVSGGRVITDFNNPLAGKEIEYEFKIKRKVTDDKEKVNALQDFFFRKRFNFSIKEKKIVFSSEAETFLDIFSKKFKEILKREIGIEKKQEEKKGEKKRKPEVDDKKHNKEK